MDDLFGEGPVDEEAPGQREHRTGVAAVGLGQSFLLVAADADDEYRVTALGVGPGRCHVSGRYGAVAPVGCHLTLTRSKRLTTSTWEVWENRSTTVAVRSS